eukprot:5891484-Ditylum_brightwellii.AAC.1
MRHHELFCVPTSVVHMAWGHPLRTTTRQCSQTQKLPQRKFRPTSRQPVAQPGFEPGSSAH